jgi:membrane protein
MAKPRGSLMSAGILLTLWGASGGMNMTITALERCYEVDRGRPFYKKRPIAVGLTLIVAFLVITLLLLMPVGSVAIKLIEEFGWHYISAPLFWTWRILRYPMAVLVMFAVLNILYYYGPAIRQRFVFFTPGAVFCVVVWLVLAMAFRIYVDKFGKYNETYGTVGGVVILLLFFYVDAVVLLVGAEINSEIDFEVLGVPRGGRDFRKALRGPGEKEEAAVVANLEPQASG